MMFLRYLWLLIFLALVAEGENTENREDNSGSDEDGVKPKDKTPTKFKSPTKMAPKMKKSMKKAALVGLDTYTGIKLQKIKSRFQKATWKQKGKESWDYSAWSSAANSEGFLCREDTDCNWLDEDL